MVLAGGIHRTVDILIADISDPTHPTQLATIEGIGEVRDVDLKGGLLVAASDCGCQRGSAEHAAWDGIGLRLYDLADPSAPVLLSEIGAPTDSVHNLFLEGDRLYASSMLENAIVIFDVSDPRNPTELGRWTPPEGSVHDQTVVGDMMYVAHVNGFSLVDVSDGANPTSILTVPVARLDGTFTSLHSLWPLPDGIHVATAQEQIGGKMRIWDVERAAQTVALPEGDEPNCVHNVYVFGDKLYAAWYLDGVRVYDISAPATPTLLTTYDTSARAPEPKTVPDIRGAWGLWVDNGRVVVGDTERGLVVLTEGGAVAKRHGGARAYQTTRSGCALAACAFRRAVQIS